MGLEHRRLLLRTGTECRPTLIVRTPGRPAATVPEPVVAGSSQYGPHCNLVTSVAWQGRRLVVSWTIIPKASLNSHVEIGVTGVVLQTLLP